MYDSAKIGGGRQRRGGWGNLGSILIDGRFFDKIEKEKRDNVVG